MEETYKTHLLQDNGIKFLYQKQITQYTDQLTTGHTIEKEWENIKNILHKAVSEALGKRKKNYRRKGLRIWNKVCEEAIKINRKLMLFSWLEEHLKTKHSTERREIDKTTDQTSTQRQWREIYCKY